MEFSDKLVARIKEALAASREAHESNDEFGAAIFDTQVEDLRRLAVDNGIALPA